MSDGKPGERNGRSRRIYLLWGLALTLLLALGLFCWLFAAPVLQTRREMEAFAAGVQTAGRSMFLPESEPFIERLGGQQRAAEKLALYAQLPDWAAPHREWAMHLLADCGRPGAVELGRFLDAPDIERRSEAVRNLGLVREGVREAADALQKALGDPDLAVRCAAADSLGRLPKGAESAVPALISALADPETRMREEVAGALGCFGRAAREAAPALEKVLGDESEHEDTRCAAAQALGGIGEARSLEPLVAALKDGKSESLRQVAAWALGRLKDSRAVEPLAAALKDEDGYVRVHAAEGLGLIGDARAAESLRAALKDGEEDVRKAARRALKEIRAAVPGKN